jgi:hypothetical protein
MKGYKGFNNKLQCAPEGKVFQYEIGKEYEHQGNVSMCSSGFHFCDSPFSVFGYYPPSDSRFAEVEAESAISGGEKSVAKKLKIVTELSLSALCGIGVKFILDKVDFTKAPATNTGYQSAATNTGYQSAATNTGDYSAATNTGSQSAATNTGTRSAATNTGYQSAATNTGFQSAATNTGYQSAATNTGDYSAATNTGKEGCAVSLGIEGKAKGAAGCWLTLAEWKKIKNKWHRVDVQTKKVDGKKVKADTFYQLKNGKFVVVEGEV